MSNSNPLVSNLLTPSLPSLCLGVGGAANIAPPSMVAAPKLKKCPKCKVPSPKGHYVREYICIDGEWVPKGVVCPTVDGTAAFEAAKRARDERVEELRIIAVARKKARRQAAKKEH